MPRPGPRPYECVRRAWHSDRHQPIRGSLIQEIFRVVNEIHNSITKKNKEWQEKLPVVVLKAEEIMYSKANSEAEYMDLKTLWERTNDAVNTIIRRDEETETGDFLQPCIEAALNLGCSPRKNSRSQRNLNPVCYFGSNSQPNNTSNMKQETNTNNPQVYQYMNFMKPSMVLSSKSKNVLLPKTNLWSPIEKCAYSTYPLYNPSFNRFGELETSGSNVVLNPICNAMDPVNPGFSQNPCPFNAVVPDKITQTHEEEGCDLSLRLGPLSLASNNKHGEVKVNKEATMRKRKAVFNQNTDEGQFCWQLKLPYGQLTGHHMKDTGL